MTNGQEYHEGQEVVVITWCKAKIITPLYTGCLHDPATEYQVEFSDGERALVGADHLEPIN